MCARAGSLPNLASFSPLSLISRALHSPSHRSGYDDATFEGPGGLDLVLPDFHGFDVPLQNLAEPGAPVVGTVAVRTDGVIISCVPPPPPGSAVNAAGGASLPSSASATTIITDATTGGRGSLGAAGTAIGGRPRFHWWQGLAIGLAAGLILLLSLGVVVLSRRVKQLSAVGGRLSGRLGRAGGSTPNGNRRGGGGGGGSMSLLPLFRSRRRGEAASAPASATAAKLGSGGAANGGGSRDDSAADVAAVTPPPTKGGGAFGSTVGGAASPPLPHSSSSAAALLLRARSNEAGSDIELGPLLGRGSFGKVFKAKWRGALVAVKVVDADLPGQRGGGGGGDLSGGGGTGGGGGGTAASDSAAAAAAAAARETALAQAIVHPNVVATYKVLTVPVSHGRAGGNGGGGGGGGGGAGGSASGLTPTKDGSAATALDGDAAGDASPPTPPPLLETWIVLEYCDRGSLEAAIAAGRFMRGDGGGGGRDMAAIYAALRDVAAGMEYLASLGVVHADLKPANILLKSTAADGERQNGGEGEREEKRGVPCAHAALSQPPLPPPLTLMLSSLPFHSPRLQGPPLRLRPVQSPGRGRHPHVDPHLRHDRLHAAGADPGRPPVLLC